MECKFVLYKGEQYRLIHQYDSGYCEIKKNGSSLYNTELVHMSELTDVKEEK
ncbi:MULTISPECIES: hypothetical protein [Metabacillus]|uniref:Fur-regulated basic protein FbpA n=1 Tax=Metabacillus elymi TaxID=2745198 RepID=A0ABX6S7A3_9BACI|nr:MULTISPECIES: hypothetical protein [Metabacillus]QNF29907.1 hypothetical protein HUW50_21910 [Metabacillus sp. KUDC1714]